MLANRCTFHEGMSAAEEPEWFFDGPVMRGRGILAASCVHEAAHIVTMFCLGGRPGSISVTTYYRAGPDGIWAGNSGRTFPWAPPGKVALTWAECPSVPVPLQVNDAITCWRPFIRNVIVACAGHAAEMRYLRSQGLPFMSRSHTDRSDCDYEARRCWTLAGRDGSALMRLCWRETQTMLEDPQVWRAVQAVEAALFSGLLWREPSDPRPGDRVEFAIEGADVEAIIQGTGLRFGAHWQDHKCGPECVRARPISRVFRKTVEAWAAENISTPKLQEIEHAT